MLIYWYNARVCIYLTYFSNVLYVTQAMYSVPWPRASSSPEKFLSGNEGNDPNPAENLESNIIVTGPSTQSAKVSLTCLS